MLPRGPRRLLKAAYLAVLMALIATFANASSQGTAFTYQGRLLEDGIAITGERDFKFSLYDSLTTGTLVGSTLTFEGESAISVSDGLFSVELDFGAGIFEGQERWLQIQAREESPDSYETLTPRQPITSIPYAVYALSANSAATAVEWDGSAIVDAEAGRTALELGSLATANTINNSDWSGTDLALTNGGTGASTAADARTNLELGSLATASSINNSNWSGTDLAVTNGGTGASDISTARSNLGLGSLATASSISNSNWSGTDLAVTNGGTGASDAATARANLGLGTLAEASTINNGNWSGTDLAVTNGGTGASDASTARTNLGLGTLSTASTINNANWSGTALAVANGGTGSTSASAARTALGAAANSGDTLTGTYTFSGDVRANANMTVNYGASSSYDMYYSPQQVFAKFDATLMYHVSSPSNGIAIGIDPGDSPTSGAIQWPIEFLPGTKLVEAEVYAEGQTGGDLTFKIIKHRRTGGSTSTAAHSESTVGTYSFPDASLTLKKITVSLNETIDEREWVYFQVLPNTSSSSKAIWVTNVVYRLRERAY